MELGDLNLLVSKFYEGQASLEEVCREIGKRDIYSSEEVAEMLATILKKQQDDTARISGMERLMTNFTQEIIPTEEIVESYQFWLGKAFKEYNMANLAKRIDSIYKKKASKLPKRFRCNLLVKEILTIYEIKNEDYARIVSFGITKEFLAQERIRNLFKFDYSAGKKFLEEEINKKRLEGIETNLRNKLKNLAQELPRDSGEYWVLKEKAKILEKQGKIKEASDLLYACDRASTKIFFPNQYQELVYFCKRKNIKDPRILDFFDIYLNHMSQRKKEGQMSDGDVAHRLAGLYEARIKAHEFLGNKEAAENDRKKRKELLEQI